MDMAQIFFCLPRKWIYVRQDYFSNYVYPKDVYKTLKEFGKIQFVSKNCNYQSLNTTPYVGKLTLVQHILLIILPFAVLEDQCLAQSFVNYWKKLHFNSKK